MSLLTRQSLSASFSFSQEHSRVLRIISKTHSLPIKTIQSVARQKWDLIKWVILVCGSDLGHFSSPTPFSLMTRGFPDTLSERQSFLRLLINSNLFDDIEQMLINLAYPSFRSQEVTDYTQLFSSPYSINTESNTRCANIIKKFSDLVLRDSPLVQNDAFKAILHESDRDTQQLVETLSWTKPMNPRMCADILDSSSAGLYDAIIRGFTTTQTLIKLAFLSSGDSLTDRLESAERMAISILICQFLTYNANITTQWPATCSARHAQTLRCLLWHMSDIEGVTIPHPCEFLTRVPVLGGKCNVFDNTEKDMSYVLGVIDELLVVDRRKLIMTSSMKPP